MVRTCSIHVWMKLVCIGFDQGRFPQLRIVVEIPESYPVVEGGSGQDEDDNEIPEVKLETVVNVMAELNAKGVLTVNVIEYESTA